MAALYEPKQMMNYLKDSRLILLGCIVSIFIVIATSNFLVKPGVSPLISFGLTILFTLPVVLIFSFLNGLNITYGDREDPYRYCVLICIGPLCLHLMLLGPFGLLLAGVTVMAALSGTARGLNAV